ncbi:hypothetical protein Ahy_A09g041563 isoform E [Arachis hypogaea]|uniref:Uncharacterized protein n=1 Tax=Arachis hypogaea TaxID=3818 RepID=A0A445BD98_ARAHY|nr:hypothetical protein Ahy_A09g041563 isoform E [Arachis hypogaea]
MRNLSFLILRVNDACCRKVSFLLFWVFLYFGYFLLLDPNLQTYHFCFGCKLYIHKCIKF